MESTNSKPLVFEVMVTFPEILQDTIVSFNELFKTDFNVVEVIEDEVNFCKISVTKYNQAQIFDLGYSLAARQYKLREEGQIGW